MKLIKADLWRKEQFADGSQPCLRTVKRWFVKGKLNGKLIEGKLFIDADNPIAESEPAEEITKFQPTIKLG